MTGSKAPPRRVLIVDDNEDAANSLAMVLQLGGHETASVYTAADALAREAGFDDHLTKPVEFSVLDRALTRVS